MALPPKEQIRAFALSLGFDAVAVARADQPLEQEFERYQQFVAKGYHGSMDWLAANAETRRRLDTDAMLAGAKSVVCLARSYKRSDEAEDPPLARRIARYARGHDYHNHVRRKLRQLAAFVRRLQPGVEARPVTDSAPLLERAWAARAGLGFVGKHGLIIVPGQGSMVLLGEVVTTLELPPDAPITERCGSCTRCLEACPTQAFAAPFVLDPRRCIAYRTIEHEGDFDTELAEANTQWLFGCDVCQEVCPFNASKQREGARTGSFEPHPRWETLSLLDLLQAGPEQAEAMLGGSPVARAGTAGMARNAAALLAHTQPAPDSAEHRALRHARTAHPDPAVRRAAEWALDRTDDATSTPPRVTPG